VVFWAVKKFGNFSVENCEMKNLKTIWQATLFFFRMTMDFVAERLGHANFADLQEIDLPHSDLRTIDVGNGEVFRNLRR
jgi:hypothetical protein